MKPPHRTPTADVEQALLDAALELLEAEGPDALTVRRIAAEAGVAPMGVYSRFGGMDGVVDALFREGFVQLQEAFASVEPGRPGDELVRGCLAYRRFALDHPGLYSVMFDKAARTMAPSQDAHAEAGAAFGLMVAGVQRALAVGELTDGDPVELAQLLWSGCHGAMSLELRGIGFVEDREALYRLIVDTMIRGLSPAVGGPAG